MQQVLRAGSYGTGVREEITIRVSTIVSLTSLIASSACASWCHFDRTEDPNAEGHRADQVVYRWNMVGRETSSEINGPGGRGVGTEGQTDQNSEAAFTLLSCFRSLFRLNAAHTFECNLSTPPCNPTVASFCIADTMGRHYFYLAYLK